METLATCIRTTLELAEVALSTERAPSDRQLEKAAAELATADQNLQEARQGERTASEVVTEVTAAAAGLNEPTMDAAVTAAQADQQAAAKKLGEVRLAHANARQRNEQVQAPFAPLVGAISTLNRSWYQGSQGDNARTVRRNVSEVLVKASAKYSAIGLAQAEVARLQRELQTQEQEVSGARSGDARMKQACAKSKAPAVTKAGEVAAQRLTVALQRQTELNDALAAAQVKLTKAQEPVQHLVELLASADALCESADAADSAYAREQEASRQDYSSSYQGDPDCTCSMTSEVTCYHCRSKQERAANEWRDNDPTR